MSQVPEPFSHGEVIPLEEPGLPTRLPDDPLKPRPVLVRTWEPKAPGAMERENKCRRPADHVLADVIGMALPIEHVFCHGVAFASDETGEITEAIRTVLVSPDGTTYGTVAAGVLSSLADVVAQHGYPPWTPAKLVRAVEVRTRKKRRTIILEPVPNPE